MNPTIVIAIDPGESEKNGSGWAIALNGKIYALGVLRPRGATLAERVRGLCRGAWDSLITGFAPPDLLVIERPVIYPGPRRKGDGNDLVDLAVVAGAFLGTIVAAEWIWTQTKDTPPTPRLELITPRDWAGTVPYKIREQRLLKSDLILVDALAHLDKVCPKGLQHNAFDAASMALWGAARLEKEVGHAEPHS